MILARLFPATWILWGATWLLLSRWSNRTAQRQSGKDRLAYLAILLIGTALVLANPSPDSWLGYPLLPQTLALGWGGYGLTLAGLLFTVWARLTLGRMWSGGVTLKEEHRIVDQGPYALARHPIYTGLTFALLGSTLARGTVAAALGVALSTASFIVKFRQEERLLAGHFGAAYTAYAGRVKGLIPFVW